MCVCETVADKNRMNRKNTNTLTNETIDFSLTLFSSFSFFFLIIICTDGKISSGHSVIIEMEESG